MLRASSSVITALTIITTGVSGCSVSPVDANGSYTLSITSRENGCEFDGWMEGNTSSGIPVEISQDDDLADATVGGVVATYLDVVLGSHVFSGEVSGDHLELVLSGTRETQSLGCAYFVSSLLDARLDGDYLEGQLVYTINDNGSPDCQNLQGCTSVQDFNGTRPPQ